MTTQDLHTVFIKHDGAFQSLTKKAMADILIKIIFLNTKNGSKINLKDIKHHLENYAQVKFNQKDIESSLGDLRSKRRIKYKNGEYYIDPNHRDEIQKQASIHGQNKDQVLNHWFGSSESDSEIIKDWFEKLIIKFFQDYRYDWINDLRSRRVNGNKKTPNIKNLLSSSFEEIDIVETDRSWLKKQFVGFLESGRGEDNELLWYYGCSMFASTLLTARNFADDLSFDLFKNSTFVLDTNILMILELEAHSLYDAFRAIEETFEQLNIKPIYFQISKEEYLRALDHKRISTLTALEKFDIEIFKESDCPFINTALKRKCCSIEDFKRYFKQLSDLPEFICESLELKNEDYQPLVDKIEKSGNDEKVKNQIDTIHRRRTGQPKRDKPKVHDAGLIGGAKFLRSNGPVWILTKDGTIREYSNENLIRDEYPLAIGIDSFIQMLAISNGGATNTASNFAPLFAQIVQSSLTPEKDTFRMEDLYFILESKIGIERLPNNMIVEVAQRVNRLRFSGLSDDEIALEIRRAYEASKLDMERELEDYKTSKFKFKSESEKLARSNIGLTKQLVDEKFKSWLHEERLKVLVSWGKLTGLLILLSILLHFLISYASDTNPIMAIALSFAIELAIIFSFKLNLKWTFRISKASKNEKKDSLEKENLQ
ncbi:MAG: hypothetical protein ABJF11_14145 [Reichenbachiella sp.]|uniref:hypothetical protein n=1 Tax=Reichenbachiella sp. TaxID=2184521 RepID=UPI003267ED33